MRYTQCVMTVKSCGRLHSPLTVPEICRFTTPLSSRRSMPNWCSSTSMMQGEITLLMASMRSILSQGRNSGVTHRITLRRRPNTPKMIPPPKRIQARSSIWIGRRSTPRCGTGSTVLISAAMHVQVTGRMAVRYRISLGPSALHRWSMQRGIFMSAPKTTRTASFTRSMEPAPHHR